jgi:N12 class adenine-specific DNA methylase
MTYTLVSTTRALSGDVLGKMALLKRDAAIDPQFELARQQLESVLPQTIAFADIDVQPSAHWLPTHYLSDFCSAELKLAVTVIYSPLNACWSITPNRAYDAKKSYKNTKAYGFDYKGWDSGGSLKDFQITGLELLEMAANLKQPKIKRRMTISGEPVQDNAATTEVMAKQQALIAAFSEWVARDPHRVRTVEEEYNRKFNGFRPVEYSGAHLKFPGMSDFWRDRMRNYQANTIAHGLMTSLLVGHEVGLGNHGTQAAPVIPPSLPGTEKIHPRSNRPDLPRNLPECPSIGGGAGRCRERQAANVRGPNCRWGLRLRNHHA